MSGFEEWQVYVLARALREMAEPRMALALPRRTGKGRAF